jgi:hypothetical protein
MAKLTKKHYIQIINRAMAGDTRTEIAKHLPVDRRRVSKIICDIVDGGLTNYLSELLVDEITPSVIVKLKETMPVGRSKKAAFIAYAEREARDDTEYQRMINSWQGGYQTGYNQARAKEE